ncbi:MAG: SDR family NAD(P)-dependent oxidoreductase [Deltaproteobacteria bacterium]|nr:SDR family NAD(P)-dependent oxidoreductase [Deltaproteobacteria bacterium]
MSSAKIAVVTGASSGIGAATVHALSKAGFRVIAGARRLETLEEVTRAAGASAIPLDVRDQESVDNFAAATPEVHLLVNNAGLALGLDPIGTAKEQDWLTMYETNVLGAMRVTRAFLPALEASGDGQIINVGSTAGFEVYPGGGGYTASKHGMKALTRTLRLELLGKPIRVTEIAPGMAETEFSLVRFGGDSHRAASVYQGLKPLTAEDIAECIAWTANRPAHVNIDEMVIRPLFQATSTQVHRAEKD